MIEVTRAAFAWPSGRTLFENVSCSVKRGESLAIIGSNGTGKTTFIKCLMKFLRFSQGEVLFNRKAADTYRRADFWKLVGYVPQAKSLSFGFSVLEMTVMGLSPYIGMGRLPRREEYEKAQAMLDYLGIADIKDASCNQISGGQLQMVLIARTMIKQPRVLIMDEPESHLDLKNQITILNLIERLNEEGNVATIVNTHFPAHALRFAQNTLVIAQKGHLWGPSPEIVTKKNLETHFGIDAEILEHRREGKKFWSVLSMGLSSG